MVSEKELTVLAAGETGVASLGHIYGGEDAHDNEDEVITRPDHVDSEAIGVNDGILEGAKTP